MKKSLKAICGIIVTVMTFAVCFTNPTVVDAGTVGAVIEDGSLYKDDELSSGDWLYTKNTGISLNKQKSSLRFDTIGVGKLFTAYTPAVSGEEFEDNLIVKFDIEITKILKDNEFGFLFGSPKLKSKISDGGYFLFFGQDNDGLFYGLKEYTASGEVVKLPVTRLYGGKIKVDAVISGEKKLTLTINDEVAYKSENVGDVNPAGFLGFAQSGEENLSSETKTVVDIIGLYIENKYYQRPETPLKSIAEFKDNEFNTQEWFLNGTAACPGGGVFVQNNEIRWDGAGQNSMFGSRYKYSNFQLIYDLYDVKNEPTIESDGWINAASFWQGVAFGIQGDSIETSYIRRDERDCLIYFGASVNSSTGERTGKGSMGFIIAGKYIANVTLPDKYDVFSVGYTDKVTVRIIVIDGKLYVGIKLADELNFYNLYEYSFENSDTPYGFIALHGEGNQFVSGRTMYYGSHFTVDNIGLTNYDSKPNLVKVGYTSNILTPLSDYDYVDSWTDDYLIYKTLGKQQ